MMQARLTLRVASGRTLHHIRAQHVTAIVPLLRRAAPTIASTCAIHPVTPQVAPTRPFSTATTHVATAQPVGSNPLLRTDVTLPRYSEIEPRHVLELKAFFEQIGQQFTELEAMLEKLLHDPSKLTYNAVLPPFEKLNDRLNFVFGTVSHLNGVRDSPALRDAIQQVEPLLVELGLKMGQSKILYSVFTALSQRSDLSPIERKIVADGLLGSKHSGVALEGELKERFNACQLRLSNLSTQFAHNVLDATKAFRLTITDPSVMDGAPAGLAELFAACARETDPKIPCATAKEGPWRVGLSAAHMVPFLSFCKSRGHRELIHKAYTTRATMYDGLDNTTILAEILFVRHSLASLLGYPTYAHMALATKMVDSPTQVHSFLEQLNQAARPTALKELQELQEFAWSDKEVPLHRSSTLRPFDVAFYADRLAKAKLRFDSEALRPYLPFPRVLSGLWKLVEELFDVRVVERASSEVGPGKTVDTWHPDVKYFDVYSSEGQVIAGFFVDAYSRPSEKRGGAWMGECVGRAAITGPDGNTTIRLPIAYLICNQAPPVGDQPSLMSFDELTTLFHEFGHVSQHLLTTVSHSSVAGIRSVEWDAVELASQFLENFTYEPEVLKQLMKHVSTGEPLPSEMQSALLAARTFRAASALVRQIHFSEIDMQLHHEGLKQIIQPIIARGGEITQADVESVAAHIAAADRSVSARISVVQPDPQSRFLNSFSHVWSGGYSAGYYSYKWSEVMSCDAFGAFEEVALKHAKSPAAKQSAWKALGRRYKDTVLALGGSVKAKEVFRAFRGRDPSIEPLLKQAGLLGNEEREEKANA